MTPLLNHQKFNERRYLTVTVWLCLTIYLAMATNSHGQEQGKGEFKVATIYILGDDAAWVPRRKEETFVGKDNPMDQFNTWRSIIVHVDPYTGEPIEDPNWQPIARLDQNVLNSLKEWRNEFGRPWSTAVYEENLTIIAKHNHSIRLAIGRMLWTAGAADLLEDYFLQQLGIEWSRPETGSSWPGWDSDEFRDYRSEWYRRNVSEFSSMSFYDGGGEAAECFSWYTSPDYVMGSLPKAFEQVLELMFRAEHPGFAEALKEDDDLRKRLPSILTSLEKARQVPEPKDMTGELFVAGYDIRHFLYFQERQAEGETIQEILERTRN